MPHISTFLRLAWYSIAHCLFQVLYIRVQNAGMQSSRFIISARSQAGLSLCFSPDRAAGKAHAKWLLNGATTQGAVKAVHGIAFAESNNLDDVGGIEIRQIPLLRTAPSGLTMG